MGLFGKIFGARDENESISEDTWICPKCGEDLESGFMFTAILRKMAFLRVPVDVVVIPKAA